MDDVCQQLIDLAALRLEPGECVAGFAGADGLSLGERLYRLENLGRAEVDAHQHLVKAQQEGLHCFVVCYDGQEWSVLGSSTWSDRQGRPIPSSGTGAHNWPAAHPLYRGSPGRALLAGVRLIVTPRLRPSALAMRVAA